MKHLSDLEIQEAAQGTVSKEANQHLNTCPLCKSQVEAYSILFAQKHSPTFKVSENFNDLVLKRVSVRKLPKVFRLGIQLVGFTTFALAFMLLIHQFNVHDYLTPYLNQLKMAVLVSGEIVVYQLLGITSLLFLYVSDAVLRGYFQKHD